MTCSSLKILSAVAAVSLPASGALAGGYAAPVVAPPVIAPAVEEVTMDWRGAYVGATLGYACCGDDRVGVNPPGAGNRFDVGNLKPSGPNLGLQLGYRWQNGPMVYGAELGLLAGKIEDSVSEGGFDSETSLTRALTAKLQGGYLMRHDTLVFASAGVTQGTFDYRVAGTRGGFTALYEATDLSMSGWTVGAGVERRLNESWSVKGEWEYMEFGKENLGTTGITPKFHNVKIGVNYRF